MIAWFTTAGFWNFCLIVYFPVLSAINATAFKLKLKYLRIYNLYEKVVQNVTDFLLKFVPGLSNTVMSAFIVVSHWFFHLFLYNMSDFLFHYSSTDSNSNFQDEDESEYNSKLLRFNEMLYTRFPIEYYISNIIWYTKR